MRRLRSSLAVSCAVIVIAGCSTGTGPSGGPPLNCSQANVRVLAVGEHQVIDPSQDGACVRLPAASGTGAEHLYVPLATASNETNNGVSGPYLVTGGSPVLASARVASIPSPRLSAFQSPLAPEAFHAMLRARERALSQSPGAALFNQGRISTAAAGPPALNDKRTFPGLRHVCVHVVRADHRNGLIGGAASGHLRGRLGALWWLYNSTARRR